ncbi:hypothetical protein [uncultured Maribacter sp.]|nr:hypothetical protein [uncultured Maribacter sp.]
MKSSTKKRSLITNWAINNTIQWNESYNVLTEKIATEQPQLKYS